MTNTKPIWTKQHVLDGMISAEAAVIDLIDYYEETGELLADPDALKDKLRDLCRENTGDLVKKADAVLAILTTAAQSAEMLIISMDHYWALLCK